jgi:hypothetical protein
MAMTTTKIMAVLSLVSALGAAGVVTARHVKKTAKADTATIVAAEASAASDSSRAGGAATAARAARTMTYEDVGHYETKPVDPIAEEEARANAQADAQRSADVTRARELDAEVAARPVDARLAQRAGDLVESVRHLALPGMDHLAADAAECGRGACRIRIPSELVEPLRAHFGASANAMHLFAFDPKDDVGSAIVYVLPEMRVSSTAAP